MPFDLLLSACLTVAVDQTSKEIVLRRRYSGTPAFTGRFRPRVRIVVNPRPGFGFFRKPASLVTVWILTVPFLTILVGFIPQLRETASLVALGAAVGGATSNLADLLRHGGIVDFIDLRVWPVFNPADTAILWGVGYVAWVLANAHA